MKKDPKASNPLSNCIAGRTVQSRRREHKCLQHPSEDLRYSCGDCNYVCVCAECVVTGDHKEHNVLSIPQAAALVRKLLAQDGKALQEQLTSLHETLRSLHSVQHGARSGLQQAQQKFRQSFQAVYKCLGQKQTMLLRELEVTSNVGANTLKDLSVNTQNYRRYLLAKHRELDNLRILGDRNPAAALNAYVELKHTYAQLLSPCERQPIDMTTKMEVPFWKLNAQNIDSLLVKTDEYIKSGTSDIQTLLHSMRQLVTAFCDLPLPLDQYPTEAKSYLEALDANQLLIAELQQNSQITAASSPEDKDRSEAVEEGIDRKSTGAEEIVVGGNVIETIECAQSNQKLFVAHLSELRHHKYVQRCVLQILATVC
eukprot:GHVQ01038369.1.p1 GENE.GHVQ01038369.1~~GHVQ01038369.1.p1  ORF type:complete len:370 (+),score=63.62 GHVQ01038369.1:652-1761(+)